MDFPTIQVTTQLPGANPDTVASLVTAPLDERDRVQPISIKRDRDAALEGEPGRDHLTRLVGERRVTLREDLAEHRVGTDLREIDVLGHRECALEILLGNGS